MQKQGEIKSLTGLRGIAACFVMIYHFYGAIIPGGMAGIFLNHGYMAVDLFFVLSGFVMAFTYRETFLVKFSFQNYFNFLYKRLARVYPLFIATTFLVSLLAMWDLVPTAVPSMTRLMVNMLMMQAWGGSDSILGPAWSISTEFFAYLAFPVLVALALGPDKMRNVLAGAGAVALLVFVATRSDIGVNEATQYVGRKGPLDVYVGSTLYPLLRCLSEFVLGLVAYRVTQIAMVMRLAAWRFASDVLAISILGLLLVRSSDVVVSLLFVPLIVSLAAGPSFTSRLLSRPALYWLGMVSYSIYLMHRLVEDIFEPPLEEIVKAFHVPHVYSVAHLPLIGLVIVCSAFTFHGIETPARNWSRRITSNRPRLERMTPAS